MTTKELKEKIKKLESSIERINDPKDKDSIELKAVLDRLKIKLELEEKAEQKEKKPEPKATTEKKKVTIKKKPEAKKEEPSPKDTKELEIEKGSKKESHKLDTAFDKDIKDAVLTLNKHRFVVREIKNKTTKKTEQVHHSPEYKNAKTIQKRVEAIFDSSVYDIAKNKKERAEKKEIIEVVNEIKDLHTLWLNEVDMIINHQVKADLEAIKKLMLGLIKEAKKNDPDDKWLKYGGLGEIAKKFDL